MVLQSTGTEVKIWNNKNTHINRPTYSLDYNGYTFIRLGGLWHVE